MINTYKIQISGRVQGVGFRPYIYNLAKRENLMGFVTNNEEGVLIYINTDSTKAHSFFEKIKQHKPKVSIIIKSNIEKVNFKKFANFIIKPTTTTLPVQIPLTPDFAVCNNCKKEVLDTNNRRYNYAFTTCIECGPRYAITVKYPFERKNTSLSEFDMCKECVKEYTDPENLRFHSQTNSCKNCGITLEITNNKGTILEIEQKEIVFEIVKYIKEGKIVGIKNSNGYILCCDAKNSKAINTLRKRKKRQNKPFAVMYPSIQEIKQDFEISLKEETSLKSNIAPIVILQNSDTISIKASDIAPKLNQTGVMLASTTLLFLIMQELKTPIIATSGNCHGSPIVATKIDALEELKTIADYFLHHNLNIKFPQDDSIIKFEKDKELILRRSRGFAPSYLEQEIKCNDTIIAMGAHLIPF